MSKSKSTWINRLLFAWFIIALAGAAFLAGVVVVAYRVWPYEILREGIKAAQTVLPSNMRLIDIKYINPAVYEGEGVVINKADQVQPGITLVAGIWDMEPDWSLAIRLYTQTGEILHQWRVVPEDIWSHVADQLPEHAHRNKEQTTMHGTLLLPNGDIILNLDYSCMARLTPDGNVVWVLPYTTHHSLFLNDDGTLWASGINWHEEADDRFPYLEPPFGEDTIVQVSPTTGEILRNISVLEVLIANDFYSLLFYRPGQHQTDDILHLNDVEVLTTELAPAFPMFEAGDIMISLRDRNAIFVLDGDDTTIKWSWIGPPLAVQHDPDFLPDGTIAVFNNGLERPSPDSTIGGTQILRFDPATRQVTPIYGAEPEQFFYTELAGKHQPLPNGNFLITEALPGRVFEVTPAGEIVWAWITPLYAPGKVAEILEGTRYPLSYAEPFGHPSTSPEPTP